MPLGSCVGASPVPADPWNSDTEPDVTSDKLLLTHVSLFLTLMNMQESNCRVYLPMRYLYVHECVNTCTYVHQYVHVYVYIHIYVCNVYMQVQQ